MCGAEDAHSSGAAEVQDPRSAAAASAQLPMRPPVVKAPPPGLLSTVQTMTMEARICRVERSVAELEQTVEKLQKMIEQFIASRDSDARSVASCGSSWVHGVNGNI